MSVSDLLEINEQDKKQLWEFFRYEKLLDDREELLSRDLRYYESQIRAIGNVNTATKFDMLTIYMKHIKNIRQLLFDLQNNRNGDLKRQMHQLQINQI